MSRIVVITGASRGIGREIARSLKEDDGRQVLVARSLSGLQETAETIRNVALIDGPIADPSVAQRIVDEVARFPDLEVCLVNNAGVARFGPVAETEWSTQAEQIETNLLGLMSATQALLPTMLERGAGQIINVLSVAATDSFPGAAAYCASKAGALAYGRCLALEVRKSGVRVTNVLPGSVDTPLWDGIAGPPRAKMLTSKAVARTVIDLLDMPKDRTVDELRLMPPDGIL